MVKKVLYGGDNQNEFNDDIFDIFAATNNFALDMKSILSILEQRQITSNSSSNTYETDFKKLYFFTIDETNRSKFLDCMTQNSKIKNMFKSVKVNNFEQIRVVFTWESILLFGTQQQQEQFNNFRREYVEYIIQSFCKDFCKYKVIGTPATSPQSDMDYDLSGVRIPNIIEQISSLHQRYFPYSLDIMFDVNLYGTVFNFKPHEKKPLDYKLNSRQKMWSFMRVVEVVMSLQSAERQKFIQALNPSHQELFKNALVELRTEFQNSSVPNSRPITNVIVNANTKSNTDKVIKSKSLKKYANLLGEYTDKSKCFNSTLQNSTLFNTTNQNTSSCDTTDFYDLVEAFSRAKFQENETYRTLGAVLHIVQKRDDFKNRLQNTEYYLHSVYDNFGFVVENLLHDKLCGRLFKPNVLKVSKYVTRIINAMWLYDKDNIYNLEYDEYLAKLKRAAADLNDARRGTNEQKIDLFYKLFLSQLNNGKEITDNLSLAIVIYEKLIKQFDNDL